MSDEEFAVIQEMGNLELDLKNAFDRMFYYDEDVQMDTHEFRDNVIDVFDRLIALVRTLLYRVDALERSTKMTNLLDMLGDRTESDDVNPLVM